MRNPRWTKETEKARMWLRVHGFGPQLMGYRSHYDFLLRNGTRVEFKSATLRNGAWKFNLHRHGKLMEEGVDAYLLQLYAPGISKSAIYLILPAPQKKLLIAVSLRSLMTRYAKYWNAFEHFNLSGPAV